MKAQSPTSMAYPDLRAVTRPQAVVVSEQGRIAIRPYWKGAWHLA